MQYLPTAFKQLEFAWKLYNYALEDKIDFNEIDRPLAFQEGNMVLVLPDRIFGSTDEMKIAFQNNLGVAFGAAAITLNRSREEVGIPLPNPIESEVDQFVSLAYQIRNAFAHDISEPRWAINQPRFARFAADHPVVALDVPGFGESEAIRDEWDIPTLADDVGAVVRTLGLESVVLVGHSVGGANGLSCPNTRATVRWRWRPLLRCSRFHRALAMAHGCWTGRRQTAFPGASFPLSVAESHSAWHFAKRI